MHKAVLTAIIIVTATVSIKLSLADPATDETYYDNGKRSLNAGLYQEAINHYQSLSKFYPDSPHYDQARLETAYAYYKLGDSDAAIEILKQFLADKPKHVHAPYAYYLAGLSQYDKSLKLLGSATNQDELNLGSDTAQIALNYFAELIEKYPGSQYNDDAKQKSTTLLEQLVIHQLNVEKKSSFAPFSDQDLSHNGRDLNWLLGQPSHYFTLQLLRSTNYDNIMNLVAKHGLNDKAIIYENKLPKDKGSIYTLLYGVYPSKRDAMEVGSSLPSALLESKPWVRKVDAIQSELRESQLAIIKSGKQNTQQDVTPEAVPQKTTTSKNHNMTENLQPIGHAFREDWILNQEPRNYTIQLTAVSRELLANRYIAHHKLSKKAAYFRTIRKGEDWYSVLYGSYPTKMAALAAAKKIQNDLGVKDTWVRKFGDIQSIIANSGNTP